MLKVFLYTLKALNQLFEKIMALDIDERHLLRLGHGEESLETEKDFSRYVFVWVSCKQTFTRQQTTASSKLREQIGEVYLKPCRISIVVIFAE